MLDDRNKTIKLLAKSIVDGVSPAEMANRLGLSLSEVFMLTKDPIYKQHYDLYCWSRELNRMHRITTVFDGTLTAIEDILNDSDILSDARAYVELLKLASQLPINYAQSSITEPSMDSVEGKRPNQTHAEYFLEKILGKNKL
jgi:hypothetical protein